ncbi:Hpt domain-containing protein [Halocynthiibacter sp.]|uniref:Hpt domain-containing protein n=1 Tax=Halocynthiibacter sp. TaxID=1979210 RepID=UPI003C43F69B
MIDWARVEELKQEVGEDDFAEVVELFLEEVEETITRLKTEPDPNNLEDDMHFLKGSALNLGFAQFSDICQAGETAAANGQADLISLPDVFTSYDNSKSEFLARQA